MKVDPSKVVTRLPLSPEKVQQYKDLLEAAVQAREHEAYVPNSHYTVGAAVLAKSGKVYTGGNAELTNYVDHAEIVAMGKAFAAGETELEALSTMGEREGKPPDYEGQTPPCGNCRQAIFDVNPAMREVEANGPDGLRVYGIQEELPEAYFRERPPWSPPPAPGHLADPLVEEAFIARSHAHTPKSRYPVGAALETRDGHIYRGVKVEVSSFAAQAERLALADALGHGERDFTRIAIVGGTDPQRGETPPNLTWDAFEALYRVAPDATVLLPDEKGNFVGHPLREFPSFLAPKKGDR